MKNLFRRNYSYGFKVTNIILNEYLANSKQHNEIYKKWLGPEFKPEYESDYSVLLCNHIGVFEIQYIKYKFAPGFIAKVELKSVPFVGFLADKLETLWLNREEKNSRTAVAEALKKRQEDYLNKKILSPLIVFPEGTTTSGDYILKFRKGAFESLKPVKSVLFKSTYHSVGDGIVPVHYQLLLNFCKLYHKFDFIELPVIYPTEYMYEHFKKEFPEKSNLSNAEIFADVIREIWCEIGSFNKSDKSFSDYMYYNNIVLNKKQRERKPE